MNMTNITNIHQNKKRSSNPAGSDLYTYQKNWYLYILQCENDLYYIGTTMYPFQRIDNHFNGFGANFTKRNKPKDIIELYCLNTLDRKVAYKLECEKTKEYRKIFGSHKVVGGKFLRLKNPISTLDKNTLNINDSAELIHIS